MKCRLEDATLALALPVGRRLFENGHFAFATLSASAHLPLEQAREIVSPWELRASLPERLLTEVALLTGLGHVGKAVSDLWVRTEALFAHLATTELNHIDALPVSTARLAGDALAYMAAFPHAPSGSDEVTAAWSARLTAALGRATACPADFAGFLTLDEEAALRRATLHLLVRAETLDRALRGFASLRLTSLTPSPKEGAHSLTWMHQRARARKELFAALTPSHLSPFPTGHAQLLEGQGVEACLSLDAALLRSQTLLDLLRQDVDTHRVTRQGSGHRDLTLENAAYGQALERQLRLQGVDAGDAQALAREVVAYAAHHESPCSEILDDEMLRMAPRIPRETLVRARLHVRHDDRDYPLSVAARNTLLASAQLVQGKPQTQ